MGSKDLSFNSYDKTAGLDAFLTCGVGLDVCPGIKGLSSDSCDKTIGLEAF